MKLAWSSAFLLPLVLLPVVMTEAQSCSNGLAGYEASDVCCPVGCGECGGVGCSKRGDGCCTKEVKDSGIKCSESRSAPCIVDTDSVDPIETQTCPGGIPGINANDVVCCPLSCGSCGGVGCSSRPGGRSACCSGEIKATHGLCSETREAPCNLIETQPTSMCSNGLAGFEASDVCCPLSCGRCGGSGCSGRGEGCCTSDVKEDGDLCSVTLAAPCNIDGPLDTNDSIDSSDDDDVDQCTNGLPGYEASDVCCPLSCGQCGGSGCSGRGEGCCTSDVKKDGDLCSVTLAAPCNIDGPLGDVNKCTNGLPGFEAKDVCCPLSCGRCGGSGCSALGDGCCTSDIKEEGIKCSDSRSAPCVVDTSSVDPVVSSDCSTKWDMAGSDVVLLMGQSNMSGRGRGYDAAIDGPNNPRIKQWTRANTVTTASERLEHADFVSQDSQVGMGTAFGRAYVENLPPQRSVLLVPTASGGAALVDGPWSPGGQLFEDAVDRMKAALASNEAKGNCVAAILWHQGEDDARNSVDRDAYESSWKDMASELRSRIPAAAEAPVILGEFTDKEIERSPDSYEPILAAVRAIPAAVSWTAVASSNGLESNPGDDLHFSAAAQREYGRRYYDKLVKAVENE